MYRARDKIILASASPRRQSLLENLGLEFEVIAADIDESVGSKEKPQDVVERLSLNKAVTIAEKNPQAWVIGADSIVVVGEEILGKPATTNDAVRMLELIQGREQEVWGGLAIVNQHRKIRDVTSFVTKVLIASLGQQQIQAYVATGEPLDKAGAYGIQGIGGSFVEKIIGSYTNVVGLNVSYVVKALINYNAIMPVTK
jgi:septum formation protein